MANAADFRKPSKEAQAPASGRKRMDLLEDMGRHSNEAHWAEADPASLRKLFEGTCRRLRKYGFSLHIPDLNYESEKDYEIILAFEVVCRPKDSRNSDSVGLVTLFGKDSIPKMIKLSPYEPGMSQILLTALSMSFGKLIREETDPGLRMHSGDHFETATK
jgi:hypothetical protein